MPQRHKRKTESGPAACFRHLGVTIPVHSPVAFAAGNNGAAEEALGHGLLVAAFGAYLYAGGGGGAPSAQQLCAPRSLAHFASALPPLPPLHPMPARALTLFVAALYADQPTPGDGFAAVHRFVCALCAVAGPPPPPAPSSKDQLTKYYQRVYKVSPRFDTTLIPASSPPTFASRVMDVRGDTVAEARGASKRLAEEAAAAAALAHSRSQ